MTTIAWDGKTLAVDSQFSEGAFKYYQNKMMTYTRGFWSSCGEAADDAIFQALLDGEKPLRKKIGKRSACLFTKDGEVWSIDPVGYVSPAPIPYAIGSGAELAIGAMYAGQSAVDAIKTVSKISPYTSGDIKAVTVKTGKLQTIKNA